MSTGHAWKAAVLCGLAFCLVGWSDLASAGFPYSAGKDAWEWVVRGVGAGLLVLGVLRTERRGAVLSAATSLFLLAAGLLALAVEHVAGLPFALTRVLPGAWTDIRDAILATSVFTGTYAGSFTFVAVYLLRISACDRLRVLRG